MPEERGLPLTRGTLVSIFAVAFFVRAAYVLWAPAILYGDPIFYSLYAELMAAGKGFSEFDGSPAVFWMPGWPALLALLYSVLGKNVAAAMWLNAVLGAATAALVAALGARLLGAAGARSAVLAGIVYALWPGNIYYCGVLMTEVPFNFALVVALWAQAAALAQTAPGARAAMGALAAGLAFAAAAMIKAEPLVLLPVLAYQAWLWKPPKAATRHVAFWCLGLALVMGPWTLRNYAHFEQWIPTSASGGTNFWIGNHPGGNGGNELGHEEAFRKAHQQETTAQTNLAQSEAGFREGLRYWREEPGAALATLPNKLWLTYRSDGGGVRNLAREAVDRPTRVWLRRVADSYWFVVLAAAVLGLSAVRGWPRTAWPVVLGIPLTWVAVHLVFIGGERFHVPETPSLALLAGAGLSKLRERFS